MIEPLTTERLILRRYKDTPEDAAAVHDLYGRPETMTFLNHLSKDRDKAAAYVARQASAMPDQEKFWHALAIVRKADERLIGEVGVFLGSAAEFSGDLGFVLLPEYQGQGYATEAAEAMLRDSFLRRGLQTITAGCDARNAASYRLLERLGMRRVEEAAGDGGQTERHYALSREEWLARNAPGGEI